MYSRSRLITVVVVALVLLAGCRSATTPSDVTVAATSAPTTVPTPTPTSAPLVATDAQGGAPISPDNAARVELMRTLEGHSAKVFGVAFSPNGHLFASISKDRTLKLWDPTSWQVIGEIKPATGEWELSFLADNVHIASDLGTVWEIASGAPEHTLRDCHRATFSPDGAWMAIAGINSPIELWRVETWRRERETVTSHPGDVFALAFSPDSQRFASGSSLGGADATDYSIKLWDVATGQEVLTFMGHQDDVHTVAFSPDGQWLASASRDATVRVWDLQTGQLRHTLRDGGGGNDVTFSPDGHLLAAATFDRTVRLWDVASGRLVRTLSHSDEVTSVAFSPDGSLLASGGYDNLVYVWGLSQIK